jgi:HD-like signal output (HDOD) protein
MTVSADLLDALDSIKPLPQVALRVISITADPDYDVQKVYETVSLDQSVTAAVLRLVNSTAYALRNPVSSLERALRFMGARNLANMVLSVCSTQLVNTQDGVPKEAKERIWKHAVAVAIAADELAQFGEDVRRDLAFTAGILHDLGRAAIPYAVLTADGVPGEGGADECWIDREKRLVGADHDELGGMLMERWKLPRELQIAVRYHSKPMELADDAEHARLAAVLHLAEVRCSGMGMAAFDEGREAPLQAAVLQRLGLSGADLADIWPKISRQIEKAEGLLNLKA